MHAHAIGRRAGPFPQAEERELQAQSYPDSPAPRAESPLEYANRWTRRAGDSKGTGLRHFLQSRFIPIPINAATNSSFWTPIGASLLVRCVKWRRNPVQLSTSSSRSARGICGNSAYTRFCRRSTSSGRPFRVMEGGGVLFRPAPDCPQPCQYSPVRR